ncbi:MAG: hypothetical protein AB7P14_25325 [Blastocatellales bacterium]
MTKRIRHSNFTQNVLLLIFFIANINLALAQTTSFTYQGRLNDSGNPATGMYDLQFRLFDALTGGNQVGSSLTRDDVTVTSGSFSVTLDFGASAFPGANRWLEISVRPGASTGAFTTLSPRQPLTSTPYAIKSTNASAADGLSAACNGCVTSAQIGSLPTNSTSYIQNTNSQQASSNFNISGDGVIGGSLGIGISPPNLGGLLHVKGLSPVRILGDTTTLSGTEAVDFFARSSLFNSDLGGMRIQRQANGNIDTLFFAAQSGNAAAEKMRITGNGFLNMSGGGTFTGLNGDGAVLTARRNNGDSYLLIDATPALQNSVLAYRKNNLNRWLMIADNNAESGGNAGSDFRLDAYNDAGNGIGTHLFVKRATGNVGIGTAAPNAKLEVVGNWNGFHGALTLTGDKPTLRFSGGAGAGNQQWILHEGTDGPGNLQFFNGGTTGAWSPMMTLTPAGKVGMGTTNPAFNLDVANAGVVVSEVRSTNERAILRLQSNVTGNDQVWTLESGLGADPLNPRIFGIYDGVAGKARLKIDPIGQVAVGVLQIEGGADFSESFDVSSVDATSGKVASANVAPGMVVVIDPAHSGKLTISRRTYDHRVAGVISGAGGIQPGVVMGQKGSVADGKHPVALTGRTYCWADAKYGAIKPGDLLTTSATPGHAMKVTNHLKAQGAILGKAMTELKSGRGLVLVLVTLQ